MTAIGFLATGPFLPTLGAKAEQVIGRFGTTRLVAAGLPAFTAGYALFVREQTHALDYAVMLLPSLFLLGLGWGLGFPALNVRGTVGVPDEEQGLAAGLFSTALQIGGAIGVAVASAIITSHGSSHDEVNAIVGSIRPTSVIVAAAALTGAVIVLAVAAIDKRRQILEPPITSGAIEEPIVEPF
jgi:fucose permease